MWQRIIGTKIVAEIPSPIENWIKEVRTAEGGGGLKKLIKLFLIYVSFPWSLLPANKIIQYAPESRYFSFGLKKKMQLHANGIDIKAITKRESFPEWPQKKFIMIGVASFAKWHGFDRVIRGIAAFIANHPHNQIVPIFYVVGDGPIRKKWESLSKELNVENYVHFLGFKTGIDLDYLYNNSHVAISSLGLYSIGLEMSSTLKSREYTARGIPFVKSGEDIDFEPTPNFLYTVGNNNISVDILDLMNWYTNLNYDNKMNSFIRDYAERNLSFSSKSEKLININ
jgi:glycosyltransferase involved in cell wall biosynthesis